MKKVVMALSLCLVTLSALSNPLVPKSKRTGIRYSNEEAVRIADAPIVRSSKGCIAYLKEDRRGFVKVSYPRDKKGNRICQPELAYDRTPDSADKNPNPY